MERDSSKRAEILERLREALEQTKALRESARGALDSDRESFDADTPVEKISIRAEQLFEQLSVIFRRAIAECSSAVVLDRQCPKRDELSKQAIEVLEHLTHLTAAQADCLRANDQKRLLELDEELEVTFGEKERLFGALRQHSKEHGC